MGAQIAPGTYRADTRDGCYWERLRNFEGTLRSIIANDFVSGGGRRHVEIRSGDAGFNTDEDCGSWTRVSGLTEDEGNVIIEATSPAEIEQNHTLNRRKYGH